MSGAIESLGISISAFEPLAISANRYLDDLTRVVNSYSHTIDAFGGYGAGTLGLVGTHHDAEVWYRDGLGRRIVSYDHAGKVMYEAFANQITIKGSGVSISIGPLLEVTNRCRVAFTTVRYATNPPIGGQSRYTTEAEVAASILKYGILYELVDAGMMHEIVADSIRDTHLYNHAYPKGDQDIEIPGGAAFSIEIGLLGYNSWLERYTYQQLGAGLQALSDKLRSVITYDPNDYLSDNFINVAPNSFEVPINDDDERTAMSIVKDLVGQGDGGGNRYLFGVYQERLVYYRPAPTSVRYHYSMHDPSQKVYDNEVEVRPWNVMPGEWMRVADLLTGEPVPLDPRRDPRNLFIESVTYSAPYSVAINGSELDVLPMALARLTGTVLANS